MNNRIQIDPTTQERIQTAVKERLGGLEIDYITLQAVVEAQQAEIIRLRAELEKKDGS